MASQTKKKGGSLLARKANEVRTKTEEELMKLDSIRQTTFWASKWRQRIQTAQSGLGHVLFEVTKPTGVELNQNVADEEAASNGRFVRYQFSKSFLQLKNVGGHR
uniref:GMP_PDE_delta domain-containing protein n=1 Tax=Macrostomum lignano TaxID=282301 RepID=A0A1I8FSV0_9PLAT